MSSQTKMFAIIGGVLIVGALAFWQFAANKPPAQQATERGYHAQ